MRPEWRSARARVSGQLRARQSLRRPDLAIRDTPLGTSRVSPLSPSGRTDASSLGAIRAEIGRMTYPTLTPASARRHGRPGRWSGGRSSGGRTRSRSDRRGGGRAPARRRPGTRSRPRRSARHGCRRARCPRLGGRERSRRSRHRWRRNGGSCARWRPGTCCRASGRTPRPRGGRRPAPPAAAAGARPRCGRRPCGRSASAGRGPVRVEPFAQLEHVVGRGVGPELAPERVADAAEELDVGAVELARPLADPQHVGRAVVPVARERVLAGEVLLVTEDERLVARVDVDLVELEGAFEVDTAGPHEAQRPLDLAGELLVALALTARGDELLHPLVHAGEVGETALAEGP